MAAICRAASWTSSRSCSIPHVPSAPPKPRRRVGACERKRPAGIGGGAECSPPPAPPPRGGMSPATCKSLSRELELTRSSPGDAAAAVPPSRTPSAVPGRGGVPVGAGFSAAERSKFPAPSLGTCWRFSTWGCADCGRRMPPVGSTSVAPGFCSLLAGERGRSGAMGASMTDAIHAGLFSPSPLAKPGSAPVPPPAVCRIVQRPRSRTPALATGRQM